MYFLYYFLFDNLIFVNVYTIIVQIMVILIIIIIYLFIMIMLSIFYLTVFYIIRYDLLNVIDLSMRRRYRLKLRVLILGVYVIWEAFFII